MEGYIAKDAIIKNVLTLLAIVFVIGFVAQFPELHRYMKIRSM